MLCIIKVQRIAHYLAICISSEKKIAADLLHVDAYYELLRSLSFWRRKMFCVGMADEVRELVGSPKESMNSPLDF
jgi:hypothetical protein